MSIDVDDAAEQVLAQGDEWQCWRALRLSGEEPGVMPLIPLQREDGAFLDLGGTASTGATGAGLCHLRLIELQASDSARRAGDWLEGAKTPSQAWTDSAEHVPGELTTPGGIEVWATAAATCGLLSLGRDPGPRALDLLRGEADLEGRVTGGAYPTFAAAAAYWLAEGPKTEMAEWGLRWARENAEEWGPEEWASALVFWAAARIPPEHLSVDTLTELLRGAASPEGFADIELTLTTLELLDRFESRA
ncbi:MAG: hypothetical protein ACR2LD_06920 [Actinomycetota bacterium]